MFLKKILFSIIFLVFKMVNASEISEEYKKFSPTSSDVRKAVAFVEHLKSQLNQNWKEKKIEDAKALSERIKKIILFGAEVGGIADPKKLGSKAYATSEEKKELLGIISITSTFDALNDSESSEKYNSFLNIIKLNLNENLLYGHEFYIGLSSDLLIKKIKEKIKDDEAFKDVKSKLDEIKIVVDDISAINNKTKVNNFFSDDFFNEELLVKIKDVKKDCEDGLKEFDLSFNYTFNNIKNLIFPDKTKQSIESIKNRIAMKQETERKRALEEKAQQEKALLEQQNNNASENTQISVEEKAKKKLEELKKKIKNSNQ